jgi:hypothetical protein
MGLLRRSLVFCAISLGSLAHGNEPFPMVDKSVQELRDIDRRAILETELAAEQHALNAAHELLAKAPADDTRGSVHRHEENVKALQRELERTAHEMPVRVSARSTGSDTPTAKQTKPRPTQAPFWDVYRRGVSSTDFQPPAKEVP